MKHLIKSNLYLIFWADKYYNIAVIAILVAPVIILQGHFSAYSIGLLLSVYFSLLKLNSTVSLFKHDRIDTAMPIKKEVIVNSRFMTAAILIGMLTLAGLLVSVWANMKRVIYDPENPRLSFNGIMISTPADEMITGLISGIILTALISSIYLYLWSKYEYDKLNLYFTIPVLILAFTLKTLMEGIAEAGMSMVFVNLLMFIIAIPVIYLSLNLSQKAYKAREF